MNEHRNVGPHGYARDRTPRCGNCTNHRREGFGGDWYCGCEQSDHYTDFTPYDFCCDEWEEVS